MVWNGICFHIIEIFVYMVKIPDIWSIFEAVEASFEAVDALGDLVDAVGAADGRIGQF